MSSIDTNAVNNVNPQDNGTSGEGTSVHYTCRLSGEKYPMEDMCTVNLPPGSVRRSKLEAEIQKLAKLGVNTELLQNLASLRRGFTYRINPDFGRAALNAKLNLELFQFFSREQSLQNVLNSPKPQLGAKAWYLTLKSYGHDGGRAVRGGRGVYKKFDGAGILAMKIVSFRYAEGLEDALGSIVNGVWRNTELEGPELAQISRSYGFLKRFFDAGNDDEQAFLKKVKGLPVDGERFQVLLKTGLWRLLFVPKGLTADNPLVQEVAQAASELPDAENAGDCTCCGHILGSGRGQVCVDQDKRQWCGDCSQSLDPDRHWLIPLDAEQQKAVVRQAKTTIRSVSIGVATEVSGLQVRVKTDVEVIAAATGADEAEI